jgi:thioredoxin-dependent peroxiredoxin
VTSPDVGELAPDFTLPGVIVEDGETTTRHFTLSERRGHPVVLAFYPADNSPGCTAQLCSYQDELASFRDLGAEIWGISRQNPHSHERFARTKNLGFPLLADEKGDVVAAYGVGLMGMAVRRSIFIIGPDGRVSWRHISLVGFTFQSADTLKRELQLIA